MSSGTTDMTNSHPAGAADHGAAGGHGAAEGHGHGGQGSVALYVWIGIILAVLTFIEVGIYFMDAFNAIEAPLLIILSTAKLILVVMFFMHLKMDHRALTWLFIAGAALAVFMVSALVVLYHVLPNFE